MKVLVCGDRNWRDLKMILQCLGSLPKDTTIIHGAASGADTLAGIAARKLGFEVHEYPAEWKTYGKSAGYIRNRQMFDSESPDLVIAFHPDLPKSKGTKDMVRYAQSQGCEVRIYPRSILAQLPEQSEGLGAAL